MRLPARLLRTSYMPCPKARHTGMPRGQPNSTVLMSSPIRLRASRKGKLLNQSRAGSLPPSVRKKSLEHACLRFSMDPSGGSPVILLSFRVKGQHHCTTYGTSPELFFLLDGALEVGSGRFDQRGLVVENLSH